VNKGTMIFTKGKFN